MKRSFIAIAALMKQESIQTAAQGEAEQACTPGGQPTTFTVQGDGTAGQAGIL
jgi:hypothetical protein